MTDLPTAYSAGIMAQSFWFIEFKKVVQLIAEGKTKEEIRILCVDENILGAPKPYRANRIFQYLYKRAEALDPDLMHLFQNSDLPTQKLINLICVLKQDRLFFEFVYEAYREKAFLGVDKLTYSDIDIFFRDKAAQHEEMESWKDTTFNHMRSNYSVYLTEAGLLSKINMKEYKITPPLIDFSLEMYLRSHQDETLLKAITGVM